MRLDAVELVRARIDLVSPFRAAHGVQSHRELLFVRALGDDEGWGECVAMNVPGYTDESIDTADAAIRGSLLPLLQRGSTAASFMSSARTVAGNPMAKTAVETALLDLELRLRGESLAHHLGAVHDRVPSGVAVGLQADTAALLAVVRRHLDEGYVRIKMKIAPGADVEPVRAVRAEFGRDVMLQVDANGAYTMDDIGVLAALDGFGLLLIEQPFVAHDLASHAALRGRIATPVCLDESLDSYDTTVRAIESGACDIVCVKPARLGGIAETGRVHDACVRAGVPMWAGGMLETGIGRAVLLAVAAMPGFTIPGDTSASDRYFARDVTDPFVLDHGAIAVPQGPGIGVRPLPDVLDRLVVSRETFAVA